MKSRTFTRRTVIASAIAAIQIISPAAFADEPKIHAAASPREANTTVLAAQILSRWAPVAEAAGLNIAVWQEQFTAQLASMSINNLQSLDRMQVKSDVDPKANYARFSQAFRSALMMKYVDSQAEKGNAKLGSTTTDQIFIPIVPCRVVDTRNVGGPISFGAARNFNFYASTGSYNWANQGGPSGSASTTCPGTVTPNGGTPSAAVATITVVGPSAGGNFVAWGGANPVPTTSVLNWNNPGDIAANTTTIPAGGRSGTGPGGAIQDFAIFYNGPSGAAQVVVDVVGYFVENKATSLDCVHLSNTGSGTIAAGGFAQIFLPACTAGYTKTGSGCSYNVTFPPGYIVEQSLNTYSDCIWINNTGAPIAGTNYNAEVTCCRVPGLP